jgi:hypothetical protein
LQVHHINGGSGAVIGYEAEDMLNQRSWAFYWAKDGICRTALGSLVHLFVILLGDENDGDVNRHGQARMAMRDHTFAMIAEDEAKKADDFGAARFGRGGILA